MLKYAKSEITLERYNSSMKHCNNRGNVPEHYIVRSAGVFYFQTQSWVYYPALGLAT